MAPLFVVKVLCVFLLLPDIQRNQGKGDTESVTSKERFRGKAVKSGSRYAAR